MKKYLLLGFIILLQYCLVQTKLQSSRQPGYKSNPKRIYITIVGSLNTDNFCDGVLAGLIQKFKEKNIVSDGLDSFGLSDQTRADFAKGISDFKPDATFMISLLEIISKNQGPGGGTFELTLTDTKTQRKVWTGKMDITGHLDSKQAISSAVDNIIAKLVSDGIIQ